MIFMVILSIVFGILVLLQIIVFLLNTQREPSSYISGKTIIELKILAQDHLSDSDKVAMLIKELDYIDLCRADIKLKDILFKKLNNEGLLLQLSDGSKLAIIRALLIQLVHSDNEIVKIKLNEVQKILKTPGKIPRV